MLLDTLLQPQALVDRRKRTFRCISPLLPPFWNLPFCYTSWSLVPVFRSHGKRVISLHISFVRLTIKGLGALVNVLF